MRNLAADDRLQLLHSALGLSYFFFNFIYHLILPASAIIDLFELPFVMS